MTKAIFEKPSHIKDFYPLLVFVRFKRRVDKEAKLLDIHRNR